MARILLIEDEPVVRHVISEMLTRAGHTVIEAGDGHEGLKLSRAQHPDLVITDVMMPGKEGIETIRDLRRDTPGLPILVISGNPEASLYLQIAKLLGAKAALTKPFRSEQLLAAVAGLLAG